MRTILIVLCLLLSSSLVARTELRRTKSKAYTLELDSRSKLSFVGDSSLHSFNVHAKQINLRAKAAGEEDPQRSLERVLLKNSLSNFEVEIPVLSLQSDSYGLNVRMYDSLKSKEYPSIFFILKNYKTQASENKLYTTRVSGNLSIAGVEKEIELILEAELLDGMLHVKGSKELLMSQFGIEPPSFLLMSTKDNILISFDFYFRISE